MTKAIRDESSKQYTCNALDKRIFQPVTGCNRLAQYTNAIIAYYFYDATNRMVKGTNQGGNELISKYVYGGRNRISADITANAKSVKMQYHSDRLGSTTHLTDQTDKVQAMAGYDEWGNRGGFKPLNFADGSLDLVHNYTGHGFDSVLGQYYAKARMYSAGNRRFLAEDKIKGYTDNPTSLVT